MSRPVLKLVALPSGGVTPADNDAALWARAAGVPVGSVGRGRYRAGDYWTFYAAGAVVAVCWGVLPGGAVAEIGSRPGTDVVAVVVSSDYQTKEKRAAAALGWALEYIKQTAIYRRAGVPVTLRVGCRGSVFYHNEELKLNARLLEVEAKRKAAA